MVYIYFDLYGLQVPINPPPPLFFFGGHHDGHRVRSCCTIRELETVLPHKLIWSKITLLPDEEIPWPRYTNESNEKKGLFPTILC